ncbi:MAG: hypothetical protein ACOYBU_19220, partial [Dermatophilaceae bacterium]
VAATLAGARALGDQDLLDRLQAAEEAIRAGQADRAATAVVIAERIQALGYRVTGAADQVAVVLAISPRSGDHLLDTAVDLCDRPVVWAGLATGRIDVSKARHILDLLAKIPDPLRAQLEAEAIEYGQCHTPHQLKRHLLAATIDADPDETLRKEAIDDRGVWITPRAHGMADVHAHLSIEHADVFYQALMKLSEAKDLPDPYDQGEDRYSTQRRADALVGFLDTITTLDIRVDVTIPADTLIGDDHRDAEIGRYGPVAASLARWLCWSPDARWHRLVTDPLTGRLIAATAKTYTIPPRVKRLVRLRDRTCRFPGCNRPAEYTDTDHIIPWAKGGKTRAVDLGGECRRHHLIKTHSAWTVQHNPTSPR